MIKKYLKELELTKPSQIQALINLFEPLLQATSVSNIQSLLNKEYKIAVVGNMSAGKSTFINAMFADDVLPAYTEATTDCPIYIYSDDNPDNDKAIIEFADDKKIMELNRKDVLEELKFYAKKDSDRLNKKYKSVKKIDLYWDFHSLKNSEDSHLDFVIIDTPGPNNTDEFKNKHSSITKNIILNEADMIIYLFDYGQIDSNLEASNDNIWDLIKLRKEENEEFEVFFVINKIDMAFEDNQSIFKIKNSKTEDEFYKNLGEYWLYHEDKAIEKIKTSAKKYGFSNPKVFTSSSEYQKLYRMNKISFRDKSKIDDLQEIFRGVFNENWEQEFLDYLRVSWIEDSTRLHIENIELNMLNTLYRDLEKVFEEIYDNNITYSSKSKQRLSAQLSEIKVSKYAAVKIEYIEGKYFKYTSRRQSIIIDTEFITIASENGKITINLDSMTKISKVKYASEKLFIVIESYNNKYSFILPNRYKKIYTALKKYIDEKSAL